MVEIMQLHSDFPWLESIAYLVIPLKKIENMDGFNFIDDNLSNVHMGVVACCMIFNELISWKD